ncbi:MAG: DUF559 domain-containing protein [Ignavibacteria bacterium]
MSSLSIFQFYDFSRGIKSMKKPYTPYNKRLKSNAKKLRNNSTLAEVILWNELKAGKLRGYKFNRQKPIGKFIVDFYCKTLSLVVEIDGESHVGNELSDIKRAEKIENLRLYVLRFPDDYVKQSLDTVMKKLNEYIDKFESSTLSKFIDWEY